jgi:hypothetical protein
VKRWKRLAFYALVGVTLLGILVLPSLQMLLVATCDRNPEQQDGRCVSCLESLAMSSQSEGWAAGEGYFLLRYQDGKWIWVRQPTNTLIFAVASGPQGEAWGAGVDILRYQDVAWRKVNVFIAEGFLTGVSATGVDDAWFVGSTLWHYHAGAWSGASLDPDINPSGVSMLSADDGWASGTRYDGRDPKNGVLLCYQNGLWNEFATTDGNMSAIAMATQTDGWAVGQDLAGDGVFYHYDGTTWMQAGSAPDTLLDQISVAPGRDAWGLGHRSEDDTELYHYTSGAWIVVPLPSGYYLRSVSAAGQDDAWLLGSTLAKDGDGYEHGIMLHHEQGTWQTTRIPPRPPASIWTIPLGYAISAYLLLLVMPFAIGALIYSWRPQADTFWRNGFVRVIWIYRIVFCLYVSGTIWLVLAARDIWDAIPSKAIIGFAVALMVFPIAAQLFMMAFMRWDGSFRWRRQT